MIWVIWRAGMRLLRFSTRYDAKPQNFKGSIQVGVSSPAALTIHERSDSAKWIFTFFSPPLFFQKTLEVQPFYLQKFTPGHKGYPQWEASRFFHQVLMVMANVLHPSIPNLKRPLGREVREGDGVPGVPGGPGSKGKMGEFQIPTNPKKSLWNIENL